MAIVRAEKDATLRLGIGASGLERRGQSGVLVFTDIPTGSLVFARVDRPAELLGVAGFSFGEPPQANKVNYAFELAPFPPKWVAGGASFGSARSTTRPAAESVVRSVE